MLRWRQITSSRTSAGLVSASIAPETVSIVPGAISWPRSIRLDQLVDHRLGRLQLLGALPRASARCRAGRPSQSSRPSSDLQHRVLGARELRGDGVVERRAAYAPSRSRTAWLTRLPSARPPTFGITTDITLPISLGPRRPTPRRARRRSPRARRRRAARAGSPRSPAPRPPRSRRPRRARLAEGLAASRRFLRSRWSTATSSPSPSFASC